jgi:pantothenate synthetase
MGAAGAGVAQNVHWQSRSGDFRTICHIVVGLIRIRFALDQDLGERDCQRLRS